MGRSTGSLKIRLSLEIEVIFYYLAQTGQEAEQAEPEGPPVASPSCKFLCLLIVLNLLCALSTVTGFSLELSLTLEQWDTLSLTLAGFSAMK